jgi:hypothetical protein
VSARAWIFASATLVGVGVVAAVAVVLTSRVGVVTGKSTAAASSWTEPSSPAPEPAAAPSSGEPVICTAERTFETCFPDVDLATVQRQLESLGAKCTRDRGDRTVTCKAGTDSDGADIRMELSSAAPVKITSVDFVASSGGVRQAPEHRQRAIDHLSDALENVLPLLLPRAPAVAGEIRDWVMHTTGTCPMTFEPQTVIGRYEIRCLDGAPITISGIKGTITSWTITASVRAPTVHSSPDCR